MTGLIIAGMTAPPDVAAVMSTAPVFVCMPKPRSDMAYMSEKMPDSKNRMRTIIATPLYPLRLIAKAEEMMAPMKRKSSMRRGFTSKPASAVRKRQTAKTVWPTAW